MNQTQVANILQLKFEQSFTYDQIAKETGHSIRTVGRVLAEHRGQLAELHRIWLEQTYESMGNDPKSRAVHHAHMLQVMRQEVLNRPLKDIPTDKLIKLISQTERACLDHDDRYYKSQSVNLRIAPEPPDPEETAPQLPSEPTSAADVLPKSACCSSPSELDNSPSSDRPIVQPSFIQVSDDAFAEGPQLTPFYPSLSSGSDDPQGSFPAELHNLNLSLEPEIK